MKPIQFVLLILGGVLVQFYFARLRSLLVDRIIAVLLTVGVMVLIVAPDITTPAANLVGVGRGVDLVIYLSLFLLSYVCMLQYSKIRAMESQITDLVRALAIDQARLPREDVLNLPDMVPHRKAG